MLTSLEVQWHRVEEWLDAAVGHGSEGSCRFRIITGITPYRHPK